MKYDSMSRHRIGSGDQNSSVSFPKPPRAFMPIQIKDQASDTNNFASVSEFAKNPHLKRKVPARLQLLASQNTSKQNLNTSFYE